MPEPKANKLKATEKEIQLDGYTFKVDTDLIDDVEAFDYIDRIENKKQVAAIIPLLTFLVGDEEYNKMKDHFTKLDAKEHKNKAGYKPRFRISKLNEVYAAIVDKFDPKG